MASAESWCRDRDIPKVQLMVRAGNSEVIHFYQGLRYVDQSVTVLGRFLDDEHQALRGAQ